MDSLGNSQTPGIIQYGRGIAMITTERAEQIHKHGFDTEHDKQHTGGELLEVARSLIYLRLDWTVYPVDWPVELFHKINKKSRVEQLAVAGALIAAEIDRQLAEEERDDETTRKESE